MGYGKYRNGALSGATPTKAKIPAAINGGERRSFTERFDLSNANVSRTIGSNNVIGDIPAGHAIQSINVHSTVSLGTSALAFGTAAAPTSLGAAKAYGTTAEASVPYLATAQKGEILEATTRIIVTTSVADLPNAGIVVVEVITSAKG